jgi:hypothetical protein
MQRSASLCRLPIAINPEFIHSHGTCIMFLLVLCEPLLQGTALCQLTSIPSRDSAVLQLTWEPPCMVG